MLNTEELTRFICKHGGHIPIVIPNSTDAVKSNMITPKPKLEGLPVLSKEPVTITLNPEDSFEAVLIDMVTLQRSKRADYASETDTLSNFRFVANMMPIKEYSVLTDIYSMVIRKVGRIANLWSRVPQNEAVRDSWMDLAVYAILGVEAIDKGEA